MGVENDLSGKVGLDTTDFKTGISAMNREIRVIESAFKASAASLGDWSQDASGLEMRIKSLTSEMDVQKKKVDALRGEYERVAEEKGKDSIAAQNLEIQLNKATETMGKMEAELKGTQSSLDEMGKASNEAGNEVKELDSSAEKASGGLEGLKKVASGLGTGLKVGVAAIAGLATAVAGVGAAISKLVFDSASASAELVDLSAKTGIGTERLQELSYVGHQVGTDLETISSSFAKLTRSIDTGAGDITEYNAKVKELEKQGKDGGEAILGGLGASFYSLGVELTDVQGNLRSTEDVFNDVITALGEVQNPTERDALAMEIFGKSAMELNPLIKAGSAEIARLSQEARDMGAVVSEEGVAALEEFDDKVSSLKDGFTGLRGNLATAFLPGFSGVVDSLRGYMKQAGDVVKESNGDFGAMAKGFSGIFRDIAKDIAGGAPDALKAGLAIIKSIGSAIGEAMPELITAGVGIIKELVSFIIENLPLLMESGMQIIQTLLEAILPELPRLIEMGLKMITELIEGLAKALPTMIPMIVKVVLTIVDTLIKNLPMLIDAALKLIIALAEGLIDALPILIPYIPKIVKAIFDAIVEALPLIGDAALRLIETLVKGIGDNLPMIGEAAGDVIEEFVDGYNRLFNQIVDVGIDLINGVWEGISKNYDWFRGQVENFFTNIVDGVKDALGIHSPSQVFQAIGENMIAGLGKGFGEQFSRVQRDIQGMVDDLSPVANVNLDGRQKPRNAPDTGESIGQSKTVNLGGIHITIYGAGGTNVSAEEIGRQAELGVRRQMRAIGLA